MFAVSVSWKWCECNKQRVRFGAVWNQGVCYLWHGGAPATASINSLCAQLFGFGAAVSGYLHLLWVFNVSCPETRAPWWSSLAASPSTGRGMCWSWRSVRTTHHLEPRNMWWALRCRGENECAPVSVQVTQKKNKTMKIITIIFEICSGNLSFILWKVATEFFFSPLCQKAVNGCIHFIFHLTLNWKSHFFQRGSVFSQGPIKVTVQELDGSFKHTLQIEENSLKHDIPCHSKSRRWERRSSPHSTLHDPEAWLVQSPVCKIWPDFCFL